MLCSTAVTGRTFPAVCRGEGSIDKIDIWVRTSLAVWYHRLSETIFTNDELELSKESVSVFLL